MPLIASGLLSNAWLLVCTHACSQVQPAALVQYCPLTAHFRALAGSMHRAASCSNKQPPQSCSRSSTGPGRGGVATSRVAAPTVSACRDARGAHATAAGADAEQIVVKLAVCRAAIASICPHAQSAAAGRCGGPACCGSQRTAQVAGSGGGWAAAGGSSGAGPACRGAIGGGDRNSDEYRNTLAAPGSGGRRGARRAGRKTPPAVPAATVCFARPAVSCIAVNRSGRPVLRAQGLATGGSRW